MAPVNRVLISSLLLVKLVSQEMHPYNLVPFIFSKNVLPMADKGLGTILLQIFCGFNVLGGKYMFLLSSALNGHRKIARHNIFIDL